MLLSRLLVFKSEDYLCRPRQYRKYARSSVLVKLKLLRLALVSSMQRISTRSRPPLTHYFDQLIDLLSVRGLSAKAQNQADFIAKELLFQGIADLSRKCIWSTN